ncbi:MAG TPA: YdeI/OmpD-associated family protein, partial [Nocardioides sp.]|nr:YdeI/OmpD-associated family protein [Nocardioides sp.]
NVELVAQLEKQRRMRAAGRAAVDAAKADGRWAAAYAGPATAETPADLLAAIAVEPEAQRMFDVLTKTNRFALYHRLNAVKKAETRERKIREFVAMLARHEAPYPQKARPE